MEKGGIDHCFIHEYWRIYQDHNDHEFYNNPILNQSLFYISFLIVSILALRDKDSDYLVEIEEKTFMFRCIGKELLSLK